MGTAAIMANKCRRNHFLVVTPIYPPDLISPRANLVVVASPGSMVGCWWWIPFSRLFQFPLWRRRRCTWTATKHHQVPRPGQAKPGERTPTTTITEGTPEATTSHQMEHNRKATSSFLPAFRGRSFSAKLSSIYLPQFICPPYYYYYGSHFAEPI